MPTNVPAAKPPADRLRASNRRTAFVLLAIAATFFVGIIGSRFIGGRRRASASSAAAAVLFLVVAIGRNLRDKR
jgi:hypothetical protein